MIACRIVHYLLFSLRIAKTVEESTDAYMKTDPDPFEDRHPCRARPDCALGHVLKNLFKNETFTNKVSPSVLSLERSSFWKSYNLMPFKFQLVSHYVTQRDDIELQTHALRLFLDTIPGLEASVVFKETVSDSIHVEKIKFIPLPTVLVERF